MPTIRDIAKLAGVSHGTASNVLNGRGNVSMKKILLVEDAARQLGYSIDERGRMLHQEFDRSIAIVLPTLQLDHYAILYATASSALQEQGFTCPLYLTSDVPSQEENVLSEIAGRRCQGVLLVTCQPDASDARSRLLRAGTKIVCLEREAQDVDSFVGFNVAQLAQRAAALIAQKNIHRLMIISGLMTHRNETEFVRCLTNAAETSGVQTHTLQTDTPTSLITAFTAVCSDIRPEVILTTSLAYARQVASVLAFRADEDRPEIISFAPACCLPQGDGIDRIYINWKKATQQACQMVLGESTQSRILLGPDMPIAKPAYCAMLPPHTELNVLMMDEPATYALQSLLPDFERATGVRVHFAIFPYGELYSVIEHMGKSGLYDAMRMDVMWLSALYKAFLHPYEAQDSSIQSIVAPMLEALTDTCRVDQSLYYAFPFAPSVQLQFYRSDVFEDIKVKRQFYETTRQNLNVPEDYAMFEALLHFFSRAENRFSPVEYGAPLVTATPVSIVCEFLPILAAMGGGMFDENGRPSLCSPESLQALQTLLSMSRLALPVPQGQLWKGAVEAFSHGRTAMLNVFTNHARSIVDLRKSKIAGRIGYAPIPGQKPLLGGGVLGVAAASKRKEAALEFIRWACSEHISVPFALLSGVSPCRSVYENEDLLELYPWLSIVPKNFSMAVCRRVPYPLDDYTVENIVGRSIKNALFSIGSPEDALQYAQDALLDEQRRRS